MGEVKKNVNNKKSIINEKCLCIRSTWVLNSNNTNDHMHDEQMSLSKTLRVFESIRVAIFFHSRLFFCPNFFLFKFLNITFNDGMKWRLKFFSHCTRNVNFNCTPITHTHTHTETTGEKIASEIYKNKIWFYATKKWRHKMQPIVQNKEKEPNIHQWSNGNYKTRPNNVLFTKQKKTNSINNNSNVESSYFPDYFFSARKKINSHYSHFFASSVRRGLLMLLLQKAINFSIYILFRICMYSCSVFFRLHPSACVAHR